MLAGGLCDRFGRRPCLLACAAIQTIGRIAQLAWPTVTVFRISRPITGCAVQVFMTALRSSVVRFKTEMKILQSNVDSER